MSVDIRIGHVLDEIGKLGDESVQCVVTSPPYWGLRDYGLEPVVWGGESGCGHEWGDEQRGFNAGRSDHGTGDPTSRLGPNRDGLPGGTDQGRGAVSQGAFCLHCSAWRGSLGLEPTPDLYVEHLVSVFREVRRVLRADGTVWLNLGDSYAQGIGSARGKPYKRHSPVRSSMWKGTRLAKRDLGNNGCVKECPGLKPKDLVMIPARVALALQADGWYLRSEIVWAKPNPMPESVRDRPTKAHEMVYLLTKSPRYYYDQEAVKLPASPSTHRRYSKGVKIPGGWDVEPGSHGTIHRKGRTEARHQPGVHPKAAPVGSGIKANESFSAAVKDIVDRRNLRTVWTIPTAPYPEAHFATFPLALVEPCIKAGTAPGDTVLDPFAGSGTVGEVARKWGRKSILIEAQPKYRELIEKRLRQGVLL